jgi:hypothetical protein
MDFSNGKFRVLIRGPGAHHDLALGGCRSCKTQRHFPLYHSPIIRVRNVQYRGDTSGPVDTLVTIIHARNVQHRGGANGPVKIKFSTSTIYNTAAAATTV